MTPSIQSEIHTYEGKLFIVKRIETVLENGTTKTFEMIDIQNAVTIMAIDTEENVLFVEQFRIGSRKSLLELPAGKVEKGENPTFSAQRELREETGMDARQIIPLGGFYMTPGYANEYMHCYLAQDLFSSPLDPDADEFIHLRKIPLQELNRLIKLGEIEDGKSLAALQLFRTHNEGLLL